MEAEGLHWGEGCVLAVTLLSWPLLPRASPLLGLLSALNLCCRAPWRRPWQAFGLLLQGLARPCLIHLG